MLNHPNAKYLQIKQLVLYKIELNEILSII